MPALLTMQNLPRGERAEIVRVSGHGPIRRRLADMGFVKGGTVFFNTLTGMRQHVGHWPGKTVAQKAGVCHYKQLAIKVVALPGAYGPAAYSPDEVIASIGNADSILIFGPGEAKGELAKRLKVGNLTERIVGIETVDKVTGRQIGARVRQHFQR